MARKYESVTNLEDGLLRVDEAAALLGLKPATVRAWLLRRKLSCVRLSARAVRLRRADIEKVIAEGFVGARQ